MKTKLKGTQINNKYFLTETEDEEEKILKIKKK